MISGGSIDSFAIHGGTTGLGLTGFTYTSPAPRAITADRPQDHGLVDATRYYGPRTFELSGLVTGGAADMWSAIDRLKGALALGTTHLLTFTPEGGSLRQATVRVDSPVDVMLSPADRQIMRWGVSLLAPDPRIYSGTQKTASGTASLNVVNAGNFSTPPVFKVTGVFGTLQVTATASGDTVAIKTTNGTQTFWVDTLERTVRLTFQGTGDLVTLDSSLTRWFSCGAGTTQVQFIPDPGTVTSGSAFWRDAWI